MATQIRLALTAALLVTTVGCGTSSSPVSPSPPSSTPLPNFQGQFTGTYVTSGCTETALSGFCAGLGFNVSRTLLLALTLDQNQALASGTVTLGVTSSIASSLGSPTMRGAFQGLIQSSGHLTGSAEVNTLNTPFCVFAPVDPGLPGGGGYAICGITAKASAWDATVAGNTLDGSFTLALSGGFSGGGAMNGTVGTANVSATLLGVTRQ